MASESSALFIHIKTVCYSAVVQIDSDMDLHLWSSAFVRETYKKKSAVFRALLQASFSREKGKEIGVKE